MLPYGKQHIDEDDIKAVSEVLRDTYLTTGPKVSEFEKKIAEFTGSKYAVAVNSGTAALHCAIKALGISKGDEVLVPAISFVASANCVLYEQGVPVFVDINPDTLNIDLDKIKENITDKTKAIIVVHFAGQLCEMEKIRKIADEHKLKVIEDAAHAIGTKDVGKYGDLATFSFHPVKNMTTGEGGAVITKCKEYYETMKTFRTHGITIDYKEREKTGGYSYDVSMLGYNYRLTDIQCALGISQLKKLPGFIEKRKQWAKLYDDLFEFNDCIEPLKQVNDNSYHIYVVKLHGVNRDDVFKELRKKNIIANVHYKPIYLMSLYQKLGYTKGLCSVSEKMYEQIITLPMYPSLTTDNIKYVVSSLNNVIKDLRSLERIK